MGNYNKEVQSYWERRGELSRKAIENNHYYLEHKMGQTLHSIDNTIVIDNSYPFEFQHPGKYRPKVYLVNAASTDMIKLTRPDHYPKTVVLNFASYRNPGGKYMEGSQAQEESLCHESNLYLILREFRHSFYEWNNRNLNYGLYQNRALLSPKVSFKHVEDTSRVDVLTCAAPNVRYYALNRMSYQNAIATPEYNATISSRIKFIMNIVNRYDCVILGAFGCGVFRNPPAKVARTFFSIIANMRLQKPMDIYFPIPTSIVNTNFDDFKYELFEYTDLIEYSIVKDIKYYDKYKYIL